MKNRAVICLSVVLSVLFSTAPQVVHADVEDLTVRTGCTSQPSYTAIVPRLSQAYDMYVKLGRRGEQAVATGFIKQYDAPIGQCHPLAQVHATGEKWEKIGTYNFITPLSPVIIELSAINFANTPNANRPQVMLVPYNEPPCVPTEECNVKVGDLEGIVQPIGTMLNQNSLHVLTVVDPKKDRLKKVDYYVDSKLVYTQAELQPFDQRFISLPQQDLVRIARYDSGQTVMIQSKAQDDFRDSFSNFLFRLSQRSPVFFYSLIAGFAALILYAILAAIARKVHDRHAERVHRGFAKGHSYTTPLQYLYAFGALHKKAFKIGKNVVLSVGIIGIVVVSIVGINNYLLTIYFVEGKSMENGYHTGDRMLVNKIPILSAQLNGREYVPKRGDIVIVRAIFGKVAAYDAKNSDTNLVKRVIGLPNDRVVVRNGVVTIYNQEQPNGFLPDKGSSWESTMVPNLKAEELDIKLGASELFVAGDNRPESIDSRFNGALETKEVVGTVIAKF